MMTSSNTSSKLTSSVIQRHPKHYTNVIGNVIQPHPKLHPKHNPSSWNPFIYLFILFLYRADLQRDKGHRFSYIMANGFDHPAKNHLISRIYTSCNGDPCLLVTLEESVKSKNYTKECNKANSNIDNQNVDLLNSLITPQSFNADGFDLKKRCY